MNIYEEIDFNEFKGDPCFVCGDLGEGHHYTTRGAGGKDCHANRLQLCRLHHRLVHDMPEQEFLEKFPEVINWLIENGWELCPLNNKWFNPKCKR